MPWVVGIDEAGYGPNLGPLVQAAVGLRLPEDDVAGWETLKPWVRRCHDKDDGRILVDDSKKVHAGANGVAKLDDGIRRALGFPDGISELKEFIPILRHRLMEPTEFNAIVDATGTKAAVVTRGVSALLLLMLADLPDTKPVQVVCDKLGGRNFYGPFLQDTFPNGWVVAERESPAESRYRILNLDRDVTVVFRPKADGDSVCVALASMVCKYLREVSMKQFNDFWQTHVPGLAPTAGYPVDAKRFYDAIRPTMAKLGIEPDRVWRKK